MVRRDIIRSDRMIARYSFHCTEEEDFENEEGEWVRYEDLLKLDKVLDVYKKALSMALSSDDCVYPGRKCPDDKIDGEHQCYKCYVAKAREELDE